MNAHSQWTPEEFQSWLAANMSRPVEHKRWVMLASRFLKGLQVDPQALLAEAIDRTLRGVRKFNREHPIEANLYGTMRSIASSWHKARKRKPEIGLEDLISSDENELDPLEVLVAPEGAQPSPEEELAFKQELDGILTLFEDREDAQMVILGRAEGLKGAALAEFAGVDQPKLASVQRLISRRLVGYRREA
ncbi:hypothetical protein PE066_11175 [Ramlibacter tataouinensis]|uniref:hypothetical protein n=1 Tax=Ramlibacter tataouinensis TaxID=94132 RepID=UPI0022F3BC6C|nr:hypothetical protein [Ramlibacter tataouinensis]WBY00045.1 hypothetical protein PE066_11175 [Ramlibacter tataouinensis]